MTEKPQLIAKKGHRTMPSPTHDDMRDAVRERYGAIATASDIQAAAAPNCCPAEAPATSDAKAQQYGYSEADTRAVPEGSNLGLGCGNPVAIASLRPGETVLDLGSGAGFDCFLAARAVGETGHVIGVDMTADMLRKARHNAATGGYANVEFRLGEIEYLPVADHSVDVIISNCVITLSPDKARVYREAFRVLKPGGRLAISDVVATAPLPDNMLDDPALQSSCLTGASLLDDVEPMLRAAGFVDIRIAPKDDSKSFIRTWIPGSTMADYLVSAIIEAVKP